MRLPDPDLADSGPLPPNEQQRSMIPLQAPFTADKIQALKVGDEVEGKDWPRGLKWTHYRKPKVRK